MTAGSGVALIAFDMFGTLASNAVDQWGRAFARIVADQALPVDPVVLHREWTLREKTFRETRTDMRSPEASPPFRTYESAWTEAFRGTFATLHVDGNAEEAARSCVGDLGRRDEVEGATGVLERLAHRWPLAVLSNADNDFLMPVISRHRWTFEAVVSSESARAYKPDPRIFQFLCRQVDVPAAHVLYVGDSPYDDVHGAKLVGMQTVRVRADDQSPGRTPTPEAVRLHTADIEIDSLLELEIVLDAHTNCGTVRGALN